MSGPTYIFAGGGTGGHLYPGLAVAEELLRLRTDAKIVLACSNRAIDRRILEPLPYAVVPQPVRPMPRGPKGWGAFLAGWARSSAQARRMIRDLRPAAVLGLGGFAAAPIVRHAARRNVPAALLNPDAVPGRANRLLARHAEAIFTQFASAAEGFPPGSRRKVRCVGCPVARRFSTARRDEALRHFGLRQDRRTLLVLGGSLGAATINEAVAAMADDLDELAETWQVLHVTGPEKVEAARGRQRRIHVAALEYCERMDLAYAAADLTVCRSGAAGVAELAATATPAVLMPYPYHRDRQQHLNAAALVDAGAAVVVQDRIDAACNAEALRAALMPLLRESSRLEAMRRGAKGVARPDAAQTVAAWLAAAKPQAKN